MKICNLDDWKICRNKQSYYKWGASSPDGLIDIRYNNLMPFSTKRDESEFPFLSGLGIIGKMRFFWKLKKEVGRRAKFYVENGMTYEQLAEEIGEIA